MKFQLTISTNNDEFAQDPVGATRNALNRVVKALEMCPECVDGQIWIFDTNGNRVGAWALDSETGD